MGTQSRSMDRCRPFYMHIMHIDHIHSRYKGIVNLSALSLFASSDHWYKSCCCEFDKASAALACE